MRGLTPKEARELLWRQGDLTYLLDENQLRLHNLYLLSETSGVVKPEESVHYWNCCRGMGKSHLLVTIAIMTCIQNPGCIVKYACATKDEARDIVRPIFNHILRDAPEDVRCTYIANEKNYRFPNGSIIKLEGLDKGNAEKLRGGSVKLFIVDEAGKVSESKTHGDFDYMMSSIILPCVTRGKHIGGKAIIATTPPKRPDHKCISWQRICELNGTYTKITIDETPRYINDRNEYDRVIFNCKGKHTEAFRREYMCENIVDPSSVVVGEFTDEVQRETVKVWKRPPFAHNYVSMDIGGKDFTIALLAYYDFRNDKIVVEDEIVMSIKLNIRFNTKMLADEIKRKESTIFTNPSTGEYEKPYKRVSDNNLIVINDMWVLHQLLFEPTRKDDRDAALNELKIKIGAGKIIINPRCIYLINHLKTATWDKNKKDFARNSADGSHFDALAALIYLVRNIEYRANPYPAGYDIPQGDNYISLSNSKKSMYETAIRSMLNIKKK